MPALPDRHLDLYERMGDTIVHGDTSVGLQGAEVWGAELGAVLAHPDMREMGLAGACGADQQQSGCAKCRESRSIGIRGKEILTPEGFGNRQGKGKLGDHSSGSEVSSPVTP